MKLLKCVFFVVVVCLLCAFVINPVCANEEETAVVDEPVDEDIMAEEIMALKAFMDSLEFRKGKIVLDGDQVTLNLPERFSYLPPKDAERVLVDLWGNPSGEGTLGMIVPDEVPLYSPESWAVIVSYNDEGYISDEDAEDIDYDDMLADMKKDSEAFNRERVEAGYEPIEIVGWAASPYYDKTAKKMHWAKELRFGDSDTNTLNYNIRILGRKGVLLLNIVAGMPQFQDINTEVPNLLAMTEFNEGHRYSDFDPKIDKVATYGIAALVAGKVATKVGIFAKLGGLLLAFKKFLVIGFVAVIAFVKSIFGRKKKDVRNPPGE